MAAIFMKLGLAPTTERILSGIGDLTTKVTKDTKEESQPKSVSCGCAATIRTGDFTTKYTKDTKVGKFLPRRHGGRGVGEEKTFTTKVTKITKEEIIHHFVNFVVKAFSLRPRRLGGKILFSSSDLRVLRGLRGESISPTLCPS
jgi:hypothetical protein